jgi:Tfp pilus assembly protein PilV
MRTRHGRRQRGYALAEAMVGGVVLMFALGGVMAGFSQARGHVTRAMLDREAAQLGVAVIEQLRARKYGDTLWNVGSRTCVPNIPHLVVPNNWTCDITVALHTEFASSTVRRQYLIARVRVGYRGRSWTMETLRW